MLIRQNAKTVKGEGEAGDYLIGGLTLAPHGLSGHQVCAEHSPGCAASCNLWFAGMRVTPQARYRAVTDTQDLFIHRPSFIARLSEDIERWKRKASRLDRIPLIRLNVGSDLDWIDVIELHPDVQFFDYTKVRSRFDRYLAGELPSNYCLTFSRHEKHHHATIDRYLRNGGNVAQVFSVDYFPQVDRVGPLPDRWKVNGNYYPVIDGDKHDCRLPDIDGSGVLIGLRLKGSTASKSRARHNGFSFAVAESRSQYGCRLGGSAVDLIWILVIVLVICAVKGCPTFPDESRRDGNGAIICDGSPHERDRSAGGAAADVR